MSEISQVAKDMLITKLDEIRERLEVGKTKEEGDTLGNNAESISLIFKTELNVNYERNRIVFGAPGTGKSHTLNEDKNDLIGNDSQDYERVTFHPNYSYANFVGTYKPIMVDSTDEELDSEKRKIISILTDNSKTAQDRYDLLYGKFKGDGLTRLPLLLGLCSDDTFKTKNQDGTDAVGDNTVERNHGKYIRPYVQLRGEEKASGEIVYEYVPGPFMRILVKALKNARTSNPKPYLLIIEEINRANVAAVFGEVFQLLDRDEDGVSKYSINTTEDIKHYLAKAENLGGKPSDYDKIKIPNNMFIWATMNSADQGVFPMDTAFKRRWEFEYIGVDAEAKEVEKGKLIYPKQIKRELGAKLIYDAICPIAMGAFYGFNPYEKEYGNMVAEDIGNSYEKCEQIALVAIEIEKHIKELSEQELRDETIVKVILQHCFDDMEDISAMAKGNSLDKLVEKVMELIREVYL